MPSSSASPVQGSEKEGRRREMLRDLGKVLLLCSLANNKVPSKVFLSSMAHEGSGGDCNIYQQPCEAGIKVMMLMLMLIGLLPKSVWADSGFPLLSRWATQAGQLLKFSCELFLRSFE